MSLLHKLKLSRASIKGTLTRVKNSINKDTSKSEAKVKLKICEETWQKFQNKQEEIEQQEIGDEATEIFIQECEKERELFESSYFETVATLQEIVDAAEEKQTPTEEVSDVHYQTVSDKINMKMQRLPEIKLPEFNGDFSKWIFFKNSFEATIHTDMRLTNVQKQQYLIGVLQGEALKVIQGFQISEENYTSAWNLLVETYDNQIMIIETHLEELLKFPSISKDKKSDSLRQLHFHIQTHISSLKAMKQPTQHWDTLIIHLARKNLDYVEQKDWQERVKGSKPENMPTLDEFLKFLIERSQAYVLLQQNRSIPLNLKTNWKDKKQGNKVIMATTQGICNVCGGNHPIFKCEMLLNQCIEERRKILKDKGHCLNCLKLGHIAKYCKGSKCKKCGRSHNTLLHQEESKVTEKNEEKLSVNHCRDCRDLPISDSVNLAKRKTSQILLSTALVYIEDVHGKRRRCRALLDPGSQSNLMTEDLSKKLALDTCEASMQIIGVDNAKTESRRITRVKLISLNSEFKTYAEFLILPCITEKLPQLEIDMEQITIPKGVHLADPTFNKPGIIDLLIGAGLFWKIVIGQIRNSISGQPALQNTRLGWIIGGEFNENTRESSTTCLKVSNEELSQQIERFWINETLPETQCFTKEDKACEEQFDNTAFRDETGRFVVRLPIRQEVTLGNSKENAVKRLESLLRRLSRQPELKKAYIDFMDEYQKLGHMTLVDKEKNQVHANSYFIPHQAVLRPESKTSKIRIVFDASAKTSNGTSLNDKLMTGPNLQRDLLQIIIRFRSHKYVITADVEKMFRQILIHPDDRKYQQILWKEEPNSDFKVYQLNTVTYGTASAPYHAMRCLNELANIYEKEFPSAAKIIREDFYMDDCLTGGSTIEDVICLQQQLQTILQNGGMLLRKWRSNDKRILQNVKNSGKTPLLVLDEEASKTLGLLWNSTEDCLQFKMKLSTQNPETKRDVASRIAQVYDPLGIVSPVLIKGKILMQLLWADKMEWDQLLPPKYLKIWIDYYSSLEQLNNTYIPRNVNPGNLLKTFNLFGFSDASEKALGACFYAVYRTHQGVYISNLICARAKVAPLKTISLPRLELEAALLLAKLLKKLEAALLDKIDTVRLWSDSTIVLGWINTETRLLKTFVANRVAKIREMTEHAVWKHVSSEENPADILSRGIAAAELQNKRLWWKGPPWLSTPNPHPEYSKEAETELPELKTTVTLIVTCTDSLLHRFSSFFKLCRAVAIWQRFIRNCKYKNMKTIGSITVEEVQQAENKVIELMQLETFHHIRQCLKNKVRFPKRTALKSLSLFIDEQDGLIKVGGRLRFSDLTEEQKHPILLPANHKITELIMKGEHERLKHCPPEQLLHAVRQKYWPISGRRIATRIVKRCLKCFRFSPDVSEVRMGDLPKERVTSVIRPFITTGIDYAGPISIRESRRRGRIHVSKGYIAVFICFSTKAVHLELVSDLTTDAFLAALQRFTARRGLCKQIFSDNGKNFVGASNALKEIQSFLEKQSNFIASSVARQQIKWQFMPPRSPHFGGLCEAAVKMIKRHLLTETQGHSFTYEEMYTILCDIEAVLNSRPLTPLPNDPNDIQVLTPAHFIIGDSLVQPVQLNVSIEPDNRLSRWKHLQKVRQRLWQRWQREYLQELQKRLKWHDSSQRINVGSLVLLIEDNVPPLQWPRGRVMKIHPGPDGEVRVVTIKTTTGIFTRSVKKICLLPIEDEECKKE